MLTRIVTYGDKMSGCVDWIVVSGLLAVVEVGTTVGRDGITYPTAVIDAADRPDVTDLARVHAIEGVGDITTTLVPVPVDADHTVIVLLVTLTSPVAAEFGMAFLLPEHRGVLEDAAEAGCLLIATSRPAPDGGDNPLWLAVDLDRALLLEALGNM